ncbi:helix-turn-helix domain-containing protein [Agaribacter flavus]|uniref:Helix-turn-helix domain-containing protein n=1 Tax=Agaribacter flavus TaxID=1902781 RepID=A0ABV7FVR5_9ALTE
MEPLNAINLIQSGTATVAILGGFLFWNKPEYKGIAVLFFFTLFAAVINILEETGITRDIYLVSPIFIMLFGPASYLAIKLFVEKSLPKQAMWHFVPVVPVLLFTSFTQEVIAIGTLWRLLYAGLTVHMLTQFQQTISQERSDADEYSMTWLVWIIIGLALFNCIDLVRLNLQPYIPEQLNLVGQGLNNLVWLLACMAIIIKLLERKPLPAQKYHQASIESADSAESFEGIFASLDAQIKDKQWYLTPRLTLSDLSELSGLQTRDISRAINLHGEVSFNEYINQYRVAYFCEQLKQGASLTLTELALASGFSSKASFNKVFKQIVGITPSQYKHELSTGSR